MCCNRFPCKIAWSFLLSIPIFKRFFRIQFERQFIIMFDLKWLFAIKHSPFTTAPENDSVVAVCVLVSQPLECLFCFFFSIEFLLFFPNLFFFLQVGCRSRFFSFKCFVNNQRRSLLFSFEFPFKIALKPFVFVFVSKLFIYTFGKFVQIL